MRFELGDIVKRGWDGRIYRIIEYDNTRGEQQYAIKDVYDKSILYGISGDSLIIHYSGY